MNGLERHANFYGVVQMKKSVPRRMGKALHDFVLIAQFFAVGAESVATDFQTLTSLLQRLLKISSDAHHLAHRFHLQSQRAVGALKLVEVPARYFHDHII